ncbi:hypothetical protein QBC34DRAFT_403999 [Podospora aff. communis PSN243]|uniref:AAA+ ATPase domain-containing protein n=1 Tax=Podospora aff. communis PSN243 TaxID=3040156 RepID=A0AAV9GT29_9PEZI|nr:hypothetical protein QBC34DRAFT_403999 [Podospora aff. communis PSN243]
MSQPAGLGEYQNAVSKGTSTTPGGEDGDAGPTFNSKFEDIKEIWQNGSVLTVTKTQNQFKGPGQKKRRFGEYSLILRRKIDLNDPGRLTLQLELQSDTLRQEFRRLARGFTSISLNHDPIIIRSPYSELYHCREKIRETIAAVTSEDLRQELQLLVTFEDQYMATSIAAIEAFKRSRTIEFFWLWGLFRPGCQVVLQNTSATAAPIEWCAILKSFVIQQDEDGASWTIVVTHTCFNGQKFGTGESAFQFPAFSGTIPINQLPAYPLEYHDRKELLIEAAIECGEMFENYCRRSAQYSVPPVGTTMAYEGPFWTLRSENEPSRRGCRIHDSPSATISGRVVVDVEGFLREHPVFRDTLLPEMRHNDTVAIGYGDDDSSIDSHRFFHHRRYRQYRRGTGDSMALASLQAQPPLSNDQRQTCSPFLPAFSFSSRQWGFVLIHELEEVKWNTEVYHKLQIDTKVKSTIHGVVKSHSARTTNFDDFIQGKGRGLVFLLHGPPGCGKTMTAESIAESLEKPLYSVNGGELGTSATSIQGALEKVFSLVSRWDAIFLLDEADAFLAQRSDSVEKNAPISVFLRVLEYQAGIIFLTTNRMKNIDSAFHSRIHVSIAYSALDAERKRVIWVELAKQKCGCALSPEQALELGALDVDGRTIKNVLRLASLFAAARGPEEDMKFEDIKAVLPLATAEMKSP